MHRYLRIVVSALLLLLSTRLYADFSFAVTPSLGKARVANPGGYNDAEFFRVDGSFFPLPQVAANIFVTKYNDFTTKGPGNQVTLSLEGAGVGAIGRWPVTEHFMPYLRAEYFLWTVTASGLGRTLGEDDGASFGLAIGAHIPIKKIFGIRTEFGGYNNVSGAHIRQLSVGLMLEF